MITIFGKELRKLRIEHQLKMTDMANALGVSSAYLSAIEHGKRKIPVHLIDQLTHLYTLSESEEHKLRLAEEAMIDTITIPLKGLSDTRRLLILEIVNAIQTASDETLQKVLQILETHRKE